VRSFVREPAKDAEDVLDLHVVQRGGRLVRDQQRRVQRERASDPDALLLSARQRRRPVTDPIREADSREQLARPRARLAPADPGPRASGSSRSPRIEARDEVERLEHDPDAGTAGTRSSPPPSGSSRPSHPP
jgi:hypothetical protein